ncbi:MAG: alpha/beta fold hydrolase [Acidobacteriota bacterium]
MRRSPLGLFLLVVLLTAGACSNPGGGPSAGDLFLVPDIVHFGDGTSMPAERGYFFVPENRAKAQGELIALSVLRFSSTAAEPKEPVFVLAGGPGSSYITPLQRGDRRYWEPAFLRLLIEDLREVGDVVIPDQRGAGMSLPFLRAGAREAQGTPDEPMTPESLGAFLRENALAAKEEWTSLGRDVDGYSAPELATDVNELRQALGYDAISIYGGSFGSQSTFTIVRLYPEIVRRIAVWGIEDIDHTFDRPSAILESLRQILADAEADPDLAPLVPEGGVLAAVERTLAELAEQPRTVEVVDPQTEETVEVAIGPVEFQTFWPQGARREGPQAWPGVLLPALDGDFTALAQMRLEMLKSPGDSPSFPRAQFQAIDCGLFPTAQRKQELETDPAIELLGDINRGYWEGCGAWQAPDVADDFKAPLETDLPALFFHGTHDTSTPLENAVTASAGYSNGHLMVVERATHGISAELYRERPELIRPLLRRFLRGEAIDDAPDRITLPPADFLPPPGF